MLTRAAALDLLDVEIAIKEAEQREALEPAYDWYGPDCGCPPGKRRPNGACPEHPRARDKQRPPEGPWQIWYVEAGRGWGKTETGAQWIRSLAEARGKKGRFALIAPTAADIRDVMIDGETGILTISPPWFRPLYEPTKRRLTWPNGAVAHCYSAEEPERLRGPQHSCGWLDECGAWKTPETFDMFQYGLRLGQDPKCLITTTPKPRDWLRRIKAKLGTILVKGTTYENRDNLAPTFYSNIITQYEGTFQGRRELEAIDEDNVAGALWTMEQLDACRVAMADVPPLDRVVVAVDPSAADPDADPDRDTAECGITVGGSSMLEHPSVGWCAHAYVLADVSLKAHPSVWGQRVIDAYHFHQADVVVAEVNNGGAMVASVLRSIDPNVNYKPLHASRGKLTRAEPIAALYQQGRVKHVREARLGALEAQMTSWVPGMKSPDRMDSAVWLATELILEGAPLTVGRNPFPQYRG
jgi:phage terminase large subunit-like protein